MRASKRPRWSSPLHSSRSILATSSFGWWLATSWGEENNMNTCRVYMHLIELIKLICHKNSLPSWPGKKAQHNTLTSRMRASKRPRCSSPHHWRLSISATSAFGWWQATSWSEEKIWTSVACIPSTNVSNGPHPWTQCALSHGQAPMFLVRAPAHHPDRQYSRANSRNDVFWHRCLSCHSEILPIQTAQSWILHIATQQQRTSAPRRAPPRAIISSKKRKWMSSEADIGPYTKKSRPANQADSELGEESNLTQVVSWQWKNHVVANKKLQ